MFDLNSFGAGMCFVMLVELIAYIVFFTGDDKCTNCGKIRKKSQS